LRKSFHKGLTNGEEEKNEEEGRQEEKKKKGDQEEETGERLASLSVGARGA